LFDFTLGDAGVKENYFFQDGFNRLIPLRRNGCQEITAIPDPSIRDACFVVTSDSYPHVLPMYAPVRALASPRTHRLLDAQVNQLDTTLHTDYVQRARRGNPRKVLPWSKAADY
jgi:hypothetical protein